MSGLCQTFTDSLYGVRGRVVADQRRVDKHTATYFQVCGDNAETRGAVAAARPHIRSR